MNLRSARHTPRRRLAALGATAILVLAACGGDDDDDDAAATVPASADDTAPPATDAPAGTVAATEAPGTTASSGGGRGDYATSAGDSSPASDNATAGGTATGVVLAETSLGSVLTADDGMTVYIFKPDNGGAPTCTGDCATAWPPLLVEDGATPTGGDGVDAAMLGTVAGADGGTQITYNGWPLYYYAADSAPGDTNGQGVGDVWYVMGADGNAIEG